jgi:2'-5' RNA ligase
MFFALWPDAPFCTRLIQAAAPVVSQMPGRALAALDLHVTLCFLGAVDEAALPRLLARAGQIEASRFELEFGRLEYWPRARIIAATAAHLPEAALLLARALAAAACEVGLPTSELPLQAHVTLVRGARAPSREAAAASPNWPALQLKLPAARFCLAESLAPGGQSPGVPAARRYGTVASWPLRA